MDVRLIDTRLLVPVVCAAPMDAEVVVSIKPPRLCLMIDEQVYDYNDLDISDCIIPYDTTMQYLYALSLVVKI